jgi:hypothetical protein
MCCTVLVNNVECETVDDLMSAGVGIIFDEHYSKVRRLGCLCSVDVEKSAKVSGFKAELDIARDEWKLTRLLQVNFTEIRDLKPRTIEFEFDEDE